MSSKAPVLAALAALTPLSSLAHYATYDDWDNSYTVQALLGAVRFEKLRFTPDNAAPGETAEVDLALLPQLGGAWTTLPKGERLQVGLEASFLLGFRFDKVNYAYLGGGGAYVSLSTSLWMFDLAGGAYANLFLDRGRRVRLYAGGGPLMVYADYRGNEEYDDGTSGTVGESAFGIGAYARTGFEFRVYERGMLGLGARGTWANIDFSDVGGSSDLVGLAAFATFTAGF